MFSRPSLMPKVSSAKRRSSNDWLRRLDGRDLRAHELQRARQRGFQLAAVDDQIEHAVVEQELAALEPFGQLLADGLLDDARSGEADECLRLRDVEIPEHRETRRDAAG